MNFLRTLTGILNKLDSADAYITRGDSYLSDGRHKRAFADYAAALRLNPNDARAHAGLGATRMDQRQLKDAIADFNVAIEMNPTDPVSYRQRGICRGSTGDHENAIADFSDAIRLNNNDAMAYLFRGMAHAERKSFQQALHDFNHAITLRPDYGEAYNNRGNVAQDMGDYDAAIADYEIARTLNPNYNQDYRNFSSRAYFGELSALFSNPLSPDFNPYHLRALIERGLSRSRAGDYSQALDDFDAALALKPNHSDAYFNRGNVYAARQEYWKAIDDYSWALEEFSSGPSDTGAVWLQRARAFLELGAYSSAVKDCNYLIARNRRLLSYDPREETRNTLSAQIAQARRAKELATRS